jgi:hypothetical protein
VVTTKPTFEPNANLQAIIDGVNARLLKLDASNPEHVAAAKYATAQATYQDRLRDWYISQHGIDNITINDKGEIRFRVELKYSGTYTVDVYADNEDDAVEKAQEELDGALGYLDGVEFDDAEAYPA